MPTWFQGIITGTALALSIAMSHAQFVAFNDHAPGAGTAANTTTWNVEGQAPGRTGPLKDITTGANLPVTLTITVSGNVTYEGAQANPSPGTPLYNTFNGFVDFTGTPNPSLALNDGAAIITYTFAGLDPNKRYSFKGSAVRGGGYTNRWTTFQLDGADFFTSSHTANALTTAQVPAILTNQVVINTGINDTPTTGDMAFWDSIEPGVDGSFSVSSLLYQGLIPNGGSSGGGKGYGMTGFRLEEFNATPVPASITAPPQNVTVGELQPASFTITAAGNPRPKYQWYKNDVAITDATNATYTLAAALLSDNNAHFKATAINVINNVTNTATSSDAILTVLADTNRPVLLRAATVSEILVLVTFSEPVTELTATNIANYAIAGPTGALVISNATLQANGSNVVLNTRSQASGVSYTVTVNNVRDRSTAANLIAANSTARCCRISRCFRNRF